MLFLYRSSSVHVSKSRKLRLGKSSDCKAHPGLTRRPFPLHGQECCLIWWTGCHTSIANLFVAYITNTNDLSPPCSHKSRIMQYIIILSSLSLQVQNCETEVDIGWQVSVLFCAYVIQCSLQINFKKRLTHSLEGLPFNWVEFWQVLEWALRRPSVSCKTLQWWQSTKWHYCSLSHSH